MVWLGAFMSGGVGPLPASRASLGPSGWLGQVPAAVVTVVAACWHTAMCVCEWVASGSGELACCGHEEAGWLRCQRAVVTLASAAAFRHRAYAALPSRHFV